MKIKGKTSDGMDISEVVRTILKLPDVTIKEGNRHDFLLKYNRPIEKGYAGLCAVGKSTSYKAHILPWLRKVTGHDNYKINYAMQNGAW